MPDDATMKEEKVIVGGGGSGSKLWLIIVIIVVLILGGTVGVYFVKPAVLPAGLVNMLDGLLGKGAPQGDTGPAPAPQQPTVPNNAGGTNP
jgi:hypothetical protein